jgi:hypothetical protein
MNFKTVLIIGMVVSWLIGILMGVYISKPIVRDNTIVEVNSKRDSIPQFQKNPTREWVIPYNSGTKFIVVETEIQGYPMFIIWREGFPKDFKVIDKKRY